MRNYDVILFDLDGTLTDSAPGILNSVRYACRKLGLENDIQTVYKVGYRLNSAS